MKSFKKVLATIVAVFMLVLAPVGAYEAGDTDPTANNTQNIDGANTPDNQDVTGDVELNGWIGTYDINDPDPEKPTPPSGSNSWVNVTIPKKVLFGSLVSDNGKVYGPNYAITNNSVKSVKVTANGLTETMNVPGISDKLDLNIVTASGTVAIITNGGNLLGSGSLPATELAVISANGNLGFTLEGQFHGTYPSVGNPGMPKYNLVLKFEAQ